MTFGGGMAMLPMLTREVVEKNGWATEEELLDYFAIGQCTPGIIAVNTATFIGYKRKGVMGGIAATAGIVFPSVVIITVIASLLKDFSHIRQVQEAFAAIRVAVGALIVNAVVRMGRSTIKNKFGLILALSAFLVITVWGVSPVFVVVAAAATGILFPLPGGDA